MSEPRDETNTPREAAEPVDVVEGPVGSARLKEPGDVDGSVPPVDRDDLQVEVNEATVDDADPAATST